jgi:hypothetical protein
MTETRNVVEFVWNPHGSCRVVEFPKGWKFHTSYSIDITLQRVFEIAQLGLTQVSSYRLSMNSFTLLKSLSNLAGKIAQK